MEIYIAFAALLLIGSKLSLQPKAGVRTEETYALITIMMIAAWAYIATAGTDYIIYKDFFESLKKQRTFSEFFEWWEPGFVALALPFVALNSTYDTFVFFAVLLSLLICSIAYRQTTTSGLSAFLFAIYCLTIGFIPFIRQDLAAATAFLAYSFQLKNKNKLFLILSILAVSIHKSAIIPVLCILMAYGYQSRKLLKTTILVFFISFLIFSAYFLLSPQRIETQLSVYFTGNFIQGFDDPGLSLFRNYLKFLFVMLISSLLYFFSLRKHNNQDTKSTYFVVLTLSVGSCILTYVSPVFARNSIYIFPFLAMLYAQASAVRNMLSIVLTLMVGAGLILFLFIAIKPLADYM